ncbi:BPSS1187 family protein [Haloferula sp.]|uniref:BPSS1187 family protein n=1 Tax=Haloferula sp. TaxID=2497595 RepID=UPI003C758492
MTRFPLSLGIVALLFLPVRAEPGPFNLSARASEIDPRTSEHPEINFVFGTDQKPEDLQHALVDTRVDSRGMLVIWLMAHNQRLFDRTSSYGYHSIQVHYARGWFSKLYSGEPPADDLFLSKIRLEATTGQDFSKAIDIPEPDGMMERAFQFVKWLDSRNPEGNWKQFLNRDKNGIDWDKVIISGSSHGSTSAARFAKHQKVARVVMFAGPRDQHEVWQSLPSATPEERFFGFSHVLDMGWEQDHYPRSWQLLDLQKFGPIVNIDQTSPPYSNTRRLITEADVGGKEQRAHNAVIPGKNSPKDKKGKFLYEDVWRYLFTHPVDQFGKPVPPDPKVRTHQRSQ